MCGRVVFRGVFSVVVSAGLKSMGQAKGVSVRQW